MAAGGTYMVTEDAPVTEFTLDAPVLKSAPEPAPNTLLVRAVKEEVNTSRGDTH